MGEVDPWMSKVNGDFIEREMGADLGGAGHRNSRESPLAFPPSDINKWQHWLKASLFMSVLEPKILTCSLKQVTVRTMKIPLPIQLSFWGLSTHSLTKSSQSIYIIEAEYNKNRGEKELSFLQSQEAFRGCGAWRLGYISVYHSLIVTDTLTHRSLNLSTIYMSIVHEGLKLQLIIRNWVSWY